MNGCLILSRTIAAASGTSCTAILAGTTTKQGATEVLVPTMKPAPVSKAVSICKTARRAWPLLGLPRSGKYLVSSGAQWPFALPTLPAFRQSSFVGESRNGQELSHQLRKYHNLSDRLFCICFGAYTMSMMYRFDCWTEGLERPSCRWTRASWRNITRGSARSYLSHGSDSDVDPRPFKFLEYYCWKYAIFV